ncbi:MAG: type II toxin-antitoxin system RelE/ParE family toxin, partial [Candidatus Omnitrophica bacterium]|nr:type II toxin-antitoxin system RelE/ParE family toxin [Candidatus Omnitrophota bacterium]
KKLYWVGSSRGDIQGFPENVKDDIGFALRKVQEGGKPASAKPWKGVSGASVLEIVENYDTDTYRACYTVRFSEVVYVLHCFQKKSNKGIKTPKRDIDLIKRRLKAAEAHYIENYKKG